MRRRQIRKTRPTVLTVHEEMYLHTPRGRQLAREIGRVGTLPSRIFANVRHAPIALMIVESLGNGKRSPHVCGRTASGSRTLHSACSFSGQETRHERADHQRSTEYEAEAIRKRREWPLLAADPAWRRLFSCFLSIKT